MRHHHVWRGALCDCGAVRCASILNQRRGGKLHEIRCKAAAVEASVCRKCLNRKVVLLVTEKVG